MPNEDWKHPELQVGEVFIGNLYDDVFQDATWKTKRKGNITHDAEGKPFSITNFSPVFVHRAEMEEEGLSAEIIDKPVY